MTTPNHYRFPNGRQPIEISRYLSSNGGQALQYIARATRTDKENVKHEDARSDIRKAIHFLVDEYERVGGNKGDLGDLLPAEARGILLPMGYSTIDVTHSYGDRTQYELNDAFFTVPEPEKLSQDGIRRLNDFLLLGQGNAYLTILS